MSRDRHRLYGYLAEFEASQGFVAALRALRDKGYTAIDGYAPQPVAAAEDMLPARTGYLALFVLIGALVAGGGFYLLEYFLAVVVYPHDIGGRPPFAWPAFIFPALEMMLLGAAVFGLVGMLVLDGLPRLNHPLFEIEAFERASRDRYFVCVLARDPRFDATATQSLLASLEPAGLHEVER